FAVAGVRLAERGGRTDEILEIFRKLWTGEETTHAGRYYRFERVTIDLPPRRRLARARRRLERQRHRRLAADHPAARRDRPRPLEPRLRPPEFCACRAHRRRGPRAIRAAAALRADHGNASFLRTFADLLFDG